jgi:putative thymidine phosphorylase
MTEQLLQDMDLSPMDRVEVSSITEMGRKVIASIHPFVHGQKKVGLSKETADDLGIQNEGFISLKAMDRPESLGTIDERIGGMELTGESMMSVVGDIMDDTLSHLEVGKLLMSFYRSDLSMAELYGLTKFLSESGDTYDWGGGLVAGKGETFNVPGNRTTPIIVAIVSSLGVKMPRLAQRALRGAPSSSVDTMEVMAKVDLDLPSIRKVVEARKGCISLSENLYLAPAEKKLRDMRAASGTDPESVITASLVARNLSLGCKYLIVDMPIGMETRFSSIGMANQISQRLTKLAARFGLRTAVEVTYGDEPIGNGIGPNLEARDVLKVLMNRPDAPMDLMEASLRLTGRLIDIMGQELFGADHRPGDGLEIAKEKLRSGTALGSFKGIVEAQGGNPETKPESITVSPFLVEIRSLKEGQLVDYDTRVVGKIARLAGAPQFKGSGIEFYKKAKDMVRRNELLLNVHAASEERRAMVYEHLSRNRIYTVD